MTGPDAILVWIAIGVFAALAILGTLICVAASLGQGAGDDDADHGADWGLEIPHDDGCNAA